MKSFLKRIRMQQRLRVTEAILVCALVFGSLAVNFAYAADNDRDGIDDELEAELARSFLPWMWFDGVWINGYYYGGEDCPGPGVILYHVRPFYTGGSPDTLLITYNAMYYDDCGLNSHEFDMEAFGITLYPKGTSPSGYGVHAMTAWAHYGTICQTTTEQVFNPPQSNLVYQSDTQYASWDTIWVAENKHANYVGDEYDCDVGGCDYPFDDECEALGVMNDGRLVPASEGQFWHLVNVGEINDHLIEDFEEVDELCGTNFVGNLGNWQIWTNRWHDDIVLNPISRYYLASPGPGIPNWSVYFDGFPAFPNPPARCGDQNISFGLSQRSIVVAHIYSALGSGELLQDMYIGEFCLGTDIDAYYWDLQDMLGNCVDATKPAIILGAIRGNREVTTGQVELGEPDGSVPDNVKPTLPTDLRAEIYGGDIKLTWRDNAQDQGWYTYGEDGFYVERRTGTCWFEIIGFPGPHSGTGDMSYIDNNPPGGDQLTYRVRAQNTAGFSEYSNEVCVFYADEEYDAVVIETDIPSQMYAGNSANVSITMRNTGFQTWDSYHQGWPAYYAVEVSLVTLEESDFEGMATLPDNNSYNVEPGEEYTFTFPITAPQVNGNRTLIAQMRYYNSNDIPPATYFGEIIEADIQVRRIIRPEIRMTY